jgi:hypothetical protein
MEYYNPYFKKPEAHYFKAILLTIAHRTNHQPKLYGRGYLVRCPSHNDTNPSLSIAEGNDGRILLKCFAGCTIKDICHSLDIEIRDLFPHTKKGIW